VRYDGKVARVEKNFAVGNLFIDIEKVEVKDFKLGGIAKFTIFASSKWNREVSGVYGEMDINSGGGSDVADIKTANVNIGPLGKAELYAYWDTDGVDEGVYDTNLKLYYEGSTTEKKMKTSVSESEIKNEFVNLGTGAVTSNKAFFDRDTIIIAAVAVLVFINILWFLKFRRRKQIPRQAL
jgi:hypothetical protein